MLHETPLSWKDSSSKIHDNVRQILKFESNQNSFLVSSSFHNILNLLTLFKLCGFHVRSTKLCNDLVKLAGFTSFKVLHCSRGICAIM